jgi:hypothetical protein
LSNFVIFYHEILFYAIITEKNPRENSKCRHFQLKNIENMTKM